MVAEARPMTLPEREPALRALWKSRRGLHRRLGQAPEAQAAYRKALSMSQQEPERRYLERRPQELEKNSLDVCRIWGPPND